MSLPSRVLVTGGAGFIGSHTCKLLAAHGVQPIVYDDLSTGHRHNVKFGPLIVGNLLDSKTLREALCCYKPEAVIHFAALAYVGDSIVDPERYYWNNVAGTLSLLAEMRIASIDRIVFSSTCATYGATDRLPLTEETEQRPINPYGASKLMVERILDDYRVAYGLRFAALRYFNASGADPDGELAEEHDPEPHLIPRCLQAAAGLIEAVQIFGTDYPTPDGTCIRDYIHVSDLAAGHVGALRRIVAQPDCFKLNLGTGTGTSVREILDGVAAVTGRKVPFTVASRRPGDPASLIADPSAARKLIGFNPQYSDLSTILRTAWYRYDNTISN